MSATLSQTKLKDYYSGARKPTFFVLKEFEAMKADRWSQAQGLSKCNTHSTYFDEEIEPCWQCYSEFETKINSRYDRLKETA